MVHREAAKGKGKARRGGILVPLRTAWQRGVHWYRLREKRPLLKIGLWLLSIMASFVAGTYKPKLVRWYVEYCTQPNIVRVNTLDYGTSQPNCGLVTFSFAIGDPIKSLHVSLTFNSEVHATALARGYKRVGNHVTVSMEGSTPSHTEPPCEIGAASEDKNGSLGVETSSDRRQVFISGHDLTVYDTQNVLVALYPDPFVWPTNDHFGWDAEATYEVYGQEFPAGFVFYTWNGRETVPIYSTGKSVSR